jgi:phosphonate transport system permease protein
MNLDALYRERPRSRFARGSGIAMLLLTAWAWSSGVVSLGDLGAERAQRNLSRFLQDVRPYPLQHEAWNSSVALEWAGAELSGRAVPALLDTLALSVVAVVLAALVALFVSFFAARNLASPEPFLPAARVPGPGRLVLFRGVVWLARGVLILARAIPEYLWAFLLLTLLGPGAWPAVLALALHNAGILGRLYAEVTENADPRSPRALRALGASRLGIALTAIWPASLGRFLLFFFYRWETCVREATILGLLGFSGLGFYILQAQAALRWDELALWTLLGSALIIAGDLLSAPARALVRNAR